MKLIDDSQIRSYGTVHDTFSELEPAYVDYYNKVICRKSWHIGPLFHFSGRNEVRMSINSGDNCLNWLDKQKPKSVLYVCFGSRVKLDDAQLIEIATALKVINHPFIWDIKQNLFLSEEIEEGKGMIINGWAPQIKILNHPATGGFMTHCGWNSVLESMVVGVPLITFPMFAEQFYNEKVIQILGNGVGVGSEVWNETPEIKGVAVGKEKIKEAVEKLMGNSGEAEMIRRRAAEISVMARSTTEEGGSSYNDVMALIQDIKKFGAKE